MNISSKYGSIERDFSLKRGITLKFKYHKSYRGFYLLDGDKFKRPYKKLDQEKTIEKVGELNFSKKEIIDIEDKFVVFVDKKEKSKKAEEIKQTNKKNKTKKTVDTNALNINSLELRYQIPAQILEHLYSTISKDTKNAEKHFMSVLSVIENITLADSLFSSKVKKIFYYSDKELESLLTRYNFDDINVADLKKDIEVNYPSQYISNLPIDYKEYEMIFVFYFIILIELLTILK